MEISITPEMDRMIQAQIASGKFTSAVDVIEEALLLLKHQDDAWEQRRAAFDEEMHRRLASLDRGEFVDPQEARERLRQKSLDHQQQLV